MKRIKVEGNILLCGEEMNKCSFVRFVLFDKKHLMHGVQTHSMNHPVYPGNRAIRVLFSIFNFDVFGETYPEMHGTKTLME